MDAAETRVTFAGGNAQADLPLLHPKLGRPMVDIRGLPKNGGYYVYDLALGETGICRSAITYVDGDNGILLYRGYPIDTVVENCSFIETAFLLLNGELPDNSQLTRFTGAIARQSGLSPEIEAICRGFPREAHPMAVMCAAAAGLAGCHHDGIDIFDPHYRKTAVHRLVAKMPTIAAMAYKHSLGEPAVAPRPDLGYAKTC